MVLRKLFTGILKVAYSYPIAEAFRKSNNAQC